jgi:hypothetical protein
LSINVEQLRLFRWRTVLLRRLGLILSRRLLFVLQLLLLRRMFLLQLLRLLLVLLLCLLPSHLISLLLYQPLVVLLLLLLEFLSFLFLLRKLLLLLLLVLLVHLWVTCTWSTGPCHRRKIARMDCRRCRPTDLPLLVNAVRANWAIGRTAFWLRGPIRPVRLMIWLRTGRLRPIIRLG